MKSLVLALILSVALCSTTPTATVNGAPMVSDSSCDLKQGFYFFWIPVKREGFTSPVQFQLQLLQPDNVFAGCSICEDTKTDEYCPYITCYLDVKKYKLSKGTVELPKTLEVSTDFDIVGWEAVIGNKTVIATGIDCAADDTSFSGYLKVSALLLVALFLF